MGEVSISSDSPCFPNASSEESAHDLLSQAHLDISFYKAAIDKEEYKNIFMRPKPDLSFTASGSIDERSNTSLYFRYTLGSDHMNFGGTGFIVDNTDLRTSGNIVAVPDLESAQFFFYLNPYLVNVSEKTKELKKYVTLKIVKIGFGKSAEQVFSTNELREHASDWGDTVFLGEIKEKM